MQRTNDPSTPVKESSDTANSPSHSRERNRRSIAHTIFTGAYRAETFGAALNLAPEDLRIRPVDQQVATGRTPRITPPAFTFPPTATASTSPPATAGDQPAWNQEQELGRTEGNRISAIRNHLLYAHGDVPQSLDTTKRVIDELLTDFVVELCFEAHRAAQLAGRQKVKVDDIKFACRKNPIYLGKIEEIFGKKDEIDRARKTLDVNDDKITKSGVKALEEEPLDGLDDDAEVAGGKK